MLYRVQFIITSKGKVDFLHLTYLIYHLKKKKNSVFILHFQYAKKIMILCIERNIKKCRHKILKRWAKSNFILNTIFKSQKLSNYGRSDFLAWICMKQKISKMKKISIKVAVVSLIQIMKVCQSLNMWMHHMYVKPHIIAWV